MTFQPSEACSGIRLDPASFMAMKEKEKNEEETSNIKGGGVAGQDVREGSPAEEHLSLVYLRQESCYFFHPEDF